MAYEAKKEQRQQANHNNTCVCEHKHKHDETRQSQNKELALLHSQQLLVYPKSKDRYRETGGKVQTSPLSPHI